MKYLIVLIVMLSSSLSMAWSFDYDGPNFDVDIDPTIQSVYLVVQDLEHQQQDASKSKFVISAYLNGSSTPAMTFYTSPGLLIENPKEGKEPELTPEGVFYPQRLSIDHVSGQFGGRVLGIFETGGMPYSIFFHNGFAIHGSKATVDGKPASKGCLRLKLNTRRKSGTYEPAKMIYTWVASALKNTRNRKSVKIKIYHTESNYVEVFRRKKSGGNKDFGATR